MPKSRQRTESRASGQTPGRSSDLMKLWAVCGNDACLSARTCRGDVRTCTRAHFARTPEGVQGFFCCLWAAKAEGRSFDEAMDGFAGSRAERALNSWREEAERRHRALLRRQRHMAH